MDREQAMQSAKHEFIVKECELQGEISRATGLPWTPESRTGYRNGLDRGYEAGYAAASNELEAQKSQVIEEDGTSFDYTPDGEGGVDLEWKTPYGFISIHVPKQGSVYYELSDGTHQALFPTAENISKAFEAVVGIIAPEVTE